jgi:hypothetical protein
MIEHAFPTQEELEIEKQTWIGRGISPDEAARISKEPSKVEYFLGIRLEMVDPVLKDAVKIFAEKGYVPYDSCQGHSQFVKAHIGFSRRLPQNAIEYFQSFADRGVELFNNKVIYVQKHEKFEKGKRSGVRKPKELKEFFIELANGAPKIGEMVFLTEKMHNGYFIGIVGLREKFPDLYHTDNLPPDRYEPPLKQEGPLKRWFKKIFK